MVVAGSGRNTGKTGMIVSVIRKWKDHGITAVKITPHFHDLASVNYIAERAGKYRISAEKDPGRSKDSSKMLQAGAEKVFLMQAVDSSLSEAFSVLLKYLPVNRPIIIESGKLAEIIHPGLLIFMHDKTTYRKNLKNAVKADLISNISQIDNALEYLYLADNNWKLNIEK